MLCRGAVREVRAGGAAPQTRQETIRIEGMDETITTTYIQSAKGYSLWIDTDVLVLQPEEEGLGMDVYAPPDIVPEVPREMVIYQGGLYDHSFEQATQDTRQVLLDNYGNAETIENADLFDGLNAAGLSATDGDNTILEYLVESDDEVFHIVITCPNEAVEGFGARVLWMLKSFEVTGAA